MSTEEDTAAGGDGAARIAAIVLVLGGLIYLATRFGDQVPAFAAWIESQGAWGPVLFILGYAIATIAFIPGSVLTLAAGAIFGLGPGVVYTFIAAVIGATGAFIVSRYVARDLVEERIANSPKFGAIDQAVGNEGFKIVALLRLSPIFPFNALNYLLGLTRVSLGNYVAASIGMIPGTLLFVYYGKVLGDVAALAGGADVDRGPEYYAVLGLGLVATLAVTIFVTRIAKRALQEQALAE